jgi:hypothetical protein
MRARRDRQGEAGKREAGKGKEGVQWEAGKERQARRGRPKERQARRDGRGETGKRGGKCALP